jgi:hypothetical protein
LFFMNGIPDQEFMNEFKAITDFNVMFDVGGNALGACLYMAKAICGANPIAFVGADFAFGYMHKFHPFDSPYDQQFHGVMPMTDVFGNRVYTWPSYAGFASWFNFIACGGQGNTSGLYVNCTEGGILGAFPNGNIKQIIQMALEEFLSAYNLHKNLPKLIDDKTKYNLLF